MPQCICCNQESSQEEDLLEVRTLHIRDYSGERRIQALGSLVHGSVCDKCTEAGLTAILSPGRTILLRVAAFLTLAFAGGLLFFVFPDLPLKLPCAGAVFLGFWGAVDAVKTALERKKHLKDLPQQQALDEVRLQILKDRLPRKEGENNITYIELSALPGAEPSSLAAKYGLLPPLAKEAIKRAKSAS